LFLKLIFFVLNFWFKGMAAFKQKEVIFREEHLCVGKRGICRAKQNGSPFTDPFTPVYSLF
jgi:hypothetical protein